MNACRIKQHWAESSMLGVLILLMGCVWAIHRDRGRTEPVFDELGLQAWLTKLDGSEQDRARLSISNMGPSAVRFLLGKVSEEGSFDDRTVEAITCCGPTTLPILLRSIQSPSAEVRLCALRSLRFLTPGLKKDHDNVAGSLARRLRDPNGFVRFEAVQVLGSLKESERVAPILIAAIRSEGVDADQFTPYVRRQAAFLLRRMGGTAEAGISALMSLRADPDPRVRETARLALLSIRGDW